MKRFLCLLVALIFTLSLAACGGNDTVIDIQSLKQSIITDLDISDALDLPTDRLSALYGIDVADVKDSACFITMGGTFPDEIVIIEAVDTSAADRIAALAQARLDDVTKQAKNYDADSYALLQKCKVQTNGNYVAMFISAQCEAMQSMFDTASQ